MPKLADWLADVLAGGELVLVDQGRPTDGDRAAEGVLASAYRVHALDVAGPPLPFDPAVGLAAATALADGCWHLLCGDGRAPPADRLGEPASAAAHLSADVCLRFLPAVYRRARARGGDDPVAAWAADLLRRWPLSGVLADLPGPPAVPLTFFDHPGLQFLYAERLARSPRAAWVPADGPARERVDRVFADLGRPVPAAPTLETA